MNKTLVVQELVIVIAANNHNPTILNPDFLKYSGIARADWELARQPIYTNRVAQVIFTNGISVVAEPNRVMFFEAIDGKAAASVIIPGMAHKYVETLPNIEYQAISHNPRGYAAFDSQQDAASKYIAETLLSPGAWQEVGYEPVRTTLNFAYTLERGQFNLSVNSAALRQQDETTTPIVLFSGNFSYELVGDTGAERLQNLHQAIDNWQGDLETYKDIVNTKFLADKAKNEVVVPNLFAMSASAES